MPTVPDDEGTSSAAVFKTLKEKTIPKIRERNQKINDKNFISGFLKNIHKKIF